MTDPTGIWVMGYWRIVSSVLRLSGTADYPVVVMAKSKAQAPVTQW